jgi:hypothetical protein
MNLYRYNSIARAFYCNVTAAGGSVSQGTLTALSIFVSRLIRSGLWDKLDEIYPLCGQGLAAATVKLKYVTNPLMTNHNFAEEDFEEWGPNGGLKPDGLTKYFDTNFPATGFRDDAHLCYIENSQTGAGGASPVTALGVTNGALEWSIGAQVEIDDRSAILGDPAVIATTPAPYSNWTSLYLANRASPTSLTLHKRTHLKATNAAASVTSPKPALNLFLAARNNAGTPDQFFANSIRFASIGQALTADEVTQFYQFVQSLQDSLGRAV